jgi:hypothetical protein
LNQLNENHIVLTTLPKPLFLLKFAFYQTNFKPNLYEAQIENRRHFCLGFIFGVSLWMPKRGIGN